MTELNDGLFYCKSKAHIYDNEKDASLCCNGYVRINNLAGEKEWIHVSQLKDSVRENLDKQQNTRQEHYERGGLLKVNRFRQLRAAVVSTLQENKKLTHAELIEKIKGLTRDDLIKIFAPIKKATNKTKK